MNDEKLSFPSARPSLSFAIITLVVILFARGITPAIQGAVVGVSALIDWMDSIASVLTQLLFVLLVGLSLGVVSAWAQSRGPFVLKLLAVALAIPLCFVVLATLALPRTVPIIHLAVCLLSGVTAVVFGADAIVRRSPAGLVAALMGVATLVRGVTSYLSELAVISHSDLTQMNDSYESARLFATVAQGMLAVALVVTWLLMVRESRVRGAVLVAVGVGAGLLMFFVADMPPAELESASAIIFSRTGQSLSTLPAPLLIRGVEYSLAFLPLVVAATLLGAMPASGRRSAAALALCLCGSFNGEVPLLGLCLLCGALGLALAARDPYGVSEAVGRV